MCVLGLLLSGLSAFGQDTFRLLVHEEGNLEPLAFANVLVECDGVFAHGVQTDFDGIAQVPLTPGCELVITSLGFEEVRMPMPQRTADLTVSLKSEVILFPGPMHWPTIYAYNVYENQQPEPQLAANTSILRGQNWARQLTSSMAQAVNLEAGVRLDERGLGGSRRISIRGSALRSPFAVRNIKAYVDGIALTSPDGSTPLELLDVADLNSLAILKGSAGSVYGPGNGGVLLATTNSSWRSSVNTEATVGQYGFLRSQTAAQYGSDRARFRVSHVYQENGGYRAQEFNHKQQVTLSGFWAASDTVSYRIYATNYSGRWGLPGGISVEDARENPRQARAFAEANGTRVERTRARVGLARIWNTGKWRNTTSVYVNTTNKINPYGTSAFFNGYKDEQAQGWGARSVLTRSYDSVGSRAGWLEISLGGEFQLEDNLLNEWELVNSNPGDFKYLNETRSTAWTTFLQAQYDDGPLELSAGVSLNQTVYDNTGESQQPDTLISLQQRFDPGVMVLPRVSMRLQTGSWQWHAQGSLGASAPSLFEMVNPEDGTFAPELTAERSLNGEVGVVRNSASMLGEVNRPLGLTAYWTRLQDAILPANEVLFTNGGEIDLRGLEAFAEAITGYEGQIWRVHGRSVAALQTYTFVTFSEGEVLFTDKFVPGLPQFTWTNQVSLRCNLNANDYNGVMNLFELTATHRWNDRTPVDNENQTWAPAWNTVDVQLRYHRNWKQWSVSANAGVLNLTDTLYSNFLQVNAFGGRFFNPAPGRMAYGGLAIRYTLPG